MPGRPQPRPDTFGISGPGKVTEQQQVGPFMATWEPQHGGCAGHEFINISSAYQHINIIGYIYIYMTYMMYIYI